MKRMLGALAAGAALVLAYTAPAYASTTGAQSFTLVGTDTNTTVIANGPIFGVGQDIETSDTTDMFVFANGTINVSHPETSDNSTFNDVACLGTDRFAGTFTLTSGTGAFAGVSGSGTYTGHVLFVADRSGTECLDSGTSFVVVNASGTATTP